MRTRTPLLAACVAALALPGAAQAARPFGSAETVSRAPGDQPAVAIGPNGSSVIAWTGPARSQRNAAFAARRASARGFGTPFSFRAQKGLLEDAAVQYDAAGDAIVAYRRLLESNFRIESATVRPSGSRTSPISISGPGSSAYEPEFATPAAGTFPQAPQLAFWRRETDRVQIARATGGRLLVSRADTLTGATRAAYAQLADGTLLGVGATSSSIVLGTRPAAGGSFALAPVATGRGPFRDASVATGQGTSAAVAWREWDGAAYRARVAVRPDGGSYGAPVTLSEPGEGAAQPRVTLAPSGAVRVTYVSTDVGTGATARGPLKVAAPDGSAPVTLTAAGLQAREFEVGADDRGDLTATWTRFVKGHRGGTVSARTLSASGALGATRRLGDAGEEGFSLALAVAPRGDAIATWLTTRQVRAIARSRQH